MKLEIEKSNGDKIVFDLDSIDNTPEEDEVEDTQVPSDVRKRIYATGYWAGRRFKNNN